MEQIHPEQFTPVDGIDAKWTRQANNLLSRIFQFRASCTEFKPGSLPRIGTKAWQESRAVRDYEVNLIAHALRDAALNGDE